MVFHLFREPGPTSFARGLADKLWRTLGLRVEVERRGKGGWIKIHFSSQKQLKRVVSLLKKEK